MDEEINVTKESLVDTIKEKFDLWAIQFKGKINYEYGLLILKKLIDKIELEYLVKIEEEVGSDGKKLFSNENKRKLELNKRLKSDMEYLIYKEKLTELTIQLLDIKYIEEYNRRLMDILKIQLNNFNE